jgi:predicted nucleic acid-binding protein
MAAIADAGFIIALRSKDPVERNWARTILSEVEPPFLTCEAVLSEAAHFVNNAWLLRMLADDHFRVAFNLTEQLDGVNRFILKYQGVDLADACIARMSELFPGAKIYSVDGKHFQLMRRFGNEPLPIALLAR